MLVVIASKIFGTNVISCLKCPLEAMVSCSLTPQILLMLPREFQSNMKIQKGKL